MPFLALNLARMANMHVAKAVMALKIWEVGKGSAKVKDVLWRYLCYVAMVVAVAMGVASIVKVALIVCVQTRGYIVM